MNLKPPSHLIQGHDAEQQACDHLQGQGLRLIERNYRSRFGEIDLIMRHADTLVFVEVRYRLSSRYGSPAESVDARKQAKIRATAEYYLQQHPQRPGESCRFDVVAITPPGVSDAKPATGGTLNWIPDAFGI